MRKLSPDRNYIPAAAKKKHLWLCRKRLYDSPCCAKCFLFLLAAVLLLPHLHGLENERARANTRPPPTTEEEDIEKAIVPLSSSLCLYANRKAALTEGQTNDHSTLNIIFFTYAAHFSDRFHRQGPCN